MLWSEINDVLFAMLYYEWGKFFLILLANYFPS